MGGVVDAHAGAGHALEHALLAEFDLKFEICVLKTAVAVHEGMGVGIFFDGAVKGLSLIHISEPTRLEC